MADRYWVGGNGNWDATSTANWSDTSGGANGFSAPTSADNVIFNTLSNATAYAVTIGLTASPATCLDVSIAGPAVGNVTITWSATSVINCYGSWTNAATGVVLSSTAGGILNFLATTTGKTITTNNVTFAGFLGVTFSGTGGGWTLGSAWTQFGTITINNGAFNTGNYSVTSGFILSTSGVTRSITLGSSTLALSNVSPWQVTSTGLTLSSGTSTIICSNASPTFAGGGLTYYNVNFTSTAGGGTNTITGNNTFNNLNIASPASNRRIMSVGNSQVVTGTLTLGAANAYNARVQVINTNVGSPITLTVGTIATLADVDFRDITAAGASGTWSGTRLGNGLGNTNITFDAGKTVYWSLVAGGNWSANAWATSSGGAAATANFPLAQDTAIIDNAGLTASNTITYDASWWLGTLNSTRTAAWTFVFGGSPTMYGDFTLTTLTTTSGTANLTFIGKGTTQTLTTNGVSLSSPIVQQSVGGTLLLNGSVTSINATSGLTLFNGTVDLNGYDLTVVAFSSSNSNTRTLARSSGGSIFITGNNATVWNTATSTGLTYTTTPVVILTYAGAIGSRTVTTGATAFINLYANSGTDNLIASSVFNDLNLTSFGGTLANSTRTIYGSLSLSSTVTTTAGTLITTFSRTAPNQTDIVCDGATINFPILLAGDGSTYCITALTLGSTRALTMTGGTLRLAAGVTNTVGSFVTTGTTAKYLVSTTPGIQATISAASGTQTVSYLTIQDSNATGGAVWDALAITNVDAGNNTGWLFSTTPSISNEITMRLRSFTQPRRF